METFMFGKLVLGSSLPDQSKSKQTLTIGTPGWQLKFCLMGV